MTHPNPVGNESVDIATLDIDDLDMDNLLGDNEDLAELDDMDEENIIPSKDSSDDEKGDAHLSPKSKGRAKSKPRHPGIKSVNANAQDAIDNIDLDTPEITGRANAGNISMDIQLDNIDPFGDEEEKKPSNYDGDPLDELPNMNLKTETNQALLDECVMTLLLPDYYQEPDLTVRREQLRKHTPQIQSWKATQIDSEMVNVADAMSKIEKVSMYDTDWHTSKHKDDESQREKYLLVAEELSALKMVPASYFGKERALGHEDDDDDQKLGAGGVGLDYLRSSTTTQTINDRVGTALRRGLGTAEKAGTRVCGACGVKLKFKPNKRSKHNYKGYICRHTHREWVFHDHLCVKLRKIKEAIKVYVYDQEKEENPNVEDENALINIETNSSQKQNSRCRPIRKTTPRKGDHNYNTQEVEEESQSSRAQESIEYSMTQSDVDNAFTEDDDDDRDRYGDDKKKKGGKKGKKGDEKSVRDKNLKKLGYITADDVPIPKHLHFRRYRTHVKKVCDRLNSEKRFKNEPLYNERFSDLPEILLYCDLNEFGVAIFEFISDSLKSKMRKSLWHILEWLALEMPTNEILHLLKRHTHLLSKHELLNYDKVCKACMEGSKFPIACTLRLSAFMYERADVDLSNRDAFREKGEQYVNVSRKLLKEIESDHLFALLLMIPTDISHQNVIEIALKYDLTYFLEDPRIVRVFSVIWFNGFDFLDPDHSFNEPNISVDSVFDRLWYKPGVYFFSPFGKFMISAILYMLYLGLFSYVTYQRIYNYGDIREQPVELVLWVASAGYVLYEILEFADSPKEYFSSMTNYWDILIALNWILLFYLRFIFQPDLEYDSAGTFDEQKQRNTMSTEIYMGGWSLQCVILWTRVASLFKISERAGPLIRMIMNMLGDVANFFLIWFLFYIGGSFAAFYIIGYDLSEVDGVNLGTLSSVMFYIFKTLLGQQDWDKSIAQPQDAQTDDDYVFDTVRSNMLQSLLFFYAIFGSVLLLNLLIAMMAASYEAVKDQALQELNKQKIDTIYDLDKSRAIITPPFNVLAYFFYAYWMAFEIITWALTFGHRQFNEEWFSPINHGLTQYSEDDEVTYLDSNNHKMKGAVINKVPKANRKREKKHKSRASTIQPTSTDEMDADLTVQNRGVIPLKEKDIIGVKKSFFKRRKMRIPSLEAENMFCRFCRFNITNDRMTIEYYLSMFDSKGIHIDPDDKRYMIELLTTVGEYGIPRPMTCQLCPNCYRPFKVTAKGPDVINRGMFIMEIVSYIVFLITLRWVILLIICIPAFIVKLIKWIIKKSAQIITGKSSERATKSIMNTSEENDDYRSKVRVVSKQEEKMEAVVRRIDASVNNLKKQLIPEEDELDADVHNLRSDEFEAEIRKMREDINKKFSTIEKLLRSSGWDD